MKTLYRALPFLVLLLVASFKITAQGLGTAQNPGQPAQSRASGQRGRSGWGGEGGALGRGTMGTVTEVAPDHFKIKTDSGELFTIFYSVNTHIMKGGGDLQRRSRDFDSEAPLNPPQPIKASEIKIGDAVAASGEVDVNAKSMGAVAIFQIDPASARRLREMQANYGRTWLMGRVTAVNEVKVTVQGGPDNAPHSFLADENTTFRKRREPITLGDIQVGDMIRAEGTVKNGTFLATTVAVMSPPSQRDDGAFAPPQ